MTSSALVSGRTDSLQRVNYFGKLPERILNKSHSFYTTSEADQTATSIQIQAFLYSVSLGSWVNKTLFKDEYFKFRK